MPVADPYAVASLIAEAGAEEALPRFRQLAEHEVTRKASGELVTVADHAVEALLTRRLAELLPGSLVVGEEAVEADPTVLTRFDRDAFVWIIDPIDGTGNFAGGNPAFAVMVGLVRGRELLAGWIHDPIVGITAIAETGSGAELRGPDGASERLRVLPPAPLAEMTGALNAGTFGSKELAATLQRNRHKLKTLRGLHCAGQDYLRLVRGEMHFLLFSKTKPWDHVPGLVIHREAGGFGQLLEGRAYLPTDIARYGILMAPDQASWQAIRSVLLAE
ncbi:fructose-1,6-bisphosphatase [Tistlia consotensis]|uniref:Fructose-1,6-bisphosphatase n=1 Tax=Tistlia consotensis USBA 355 TaxID=560819 RepID=A0A1Y6BT15_9PROT|nr:inositol monophosphatase family protein [Tistlia consotensis]SMF25459.1 fructose-1,6-bisphosphatase [Tistlia consotensis USBA 355]SNR59319.1 fructose-1,6-bisphosphatase [Tistlia consotensis]